MTDHDRQGPADGPPPAQAVAAVCRDVVERLLLALPSLPAAIPRAPLVAGLEQMLGSLAHLAASELRDADHLDVLGVALGATARARALFAALGDERARRWTRRLEAAERTLTLCRERTMDALVAIQDRLLRFRPSAPRDTPLPPLKASVGLPSLHVLGRGPLLPAVQVESSEDDLDDQTDERELGALMAAGAAQTAEAELADDDAAHEPAEPVPLASAAELGGESGDEGDEQRRLAAAVNAADGHGAHERPGPPGERAQLWALARDCMEDVGILGGLRAPRPDDPWSDAMQRFEQRLLDALDALVALGRPVASLGPEPLCFDVLAELLAWARVQVVPDPVRAFARSLVLGCLDGEDKIRAAVLALQQSHPDTYGAQRNGLVLSSSPFVAAAMQRLCREGSPTLTRLGLEVLRLRREATLPGLLPLLEHPDRPTRIRALRCLAVVPERGPAIAQLEDTLRTEDDPWVLCAAIESLLRLGRSSGLDALRRLLDEERDAPGALDDESRRALVRLLGIAGGHGDFERLLPWLGEEPIEAEALGWHGHPGGVEPLIELLERTSGAAATWPLRVAAAHALHRITGAGLARVEPEDELEPNAITTRPDRWREHWARHGAELATVRRYRFGQPYAPLATVDELGRDGVVHRVRELCALELGVATAGASRVEPGDWVARQRAELAAAQAMLGGRPGSAGSAHAPGQWLGDRLQRG